MARLEHLSPSSNVGLAVLEYVNREDVGAADIALVASADPVLTARIMRMANSAFYGMGGRISQLNVAISMLGISTVRSLAVAAVIEKVGRISDDDWLHAINCAVASSYVAPQYRADPAGAFSVGMLHDIGRSLINEFDPAGYNDINVLLHSGFTESVEHTVTTMERERYGVTHAQLGAEVLAAWNFPEGLCHAISSHHEPDARDNPLLATIRAGDRISYILESPTSEPVDDQLLPDCYDAEQLPIALAEVGRKSEEIRSLFI
jgi:putative nucleotidyltransferase with HDIG domain